MTTTVSGRWGKNDLIETAENVGVCAGTPTYDILQRALDSMFDLRGDPASAGPNVPCDAISVALQTTGHRAHFGGVVAGPPIESACE